MDKVRFTVGDAHVWQGFHSRGDNGMIGALVFVTADTLRAVTDHFANDILRDEWQRVHNGPSDDWATLAFGDEGTIRSPIDGLTPLYRLTFAEVVIVQRFDPTAGRTYDRHEADGTITKVPYGAWLNEDTIDGIDGFDDAGPDFEPVTHGFFIDPKDVAEGRTDAPLIETKRSRAERVAMIEGQEYVVDVYVPLSVTVRANKGDEAMAEAMALEQMDLDGVRGAIEAAIDPTSFFVGDAPLKVEVGEA